jgi:hypothetical protein
MGVGVVFTTTRHTSDALKLLASWVASRDDVPTEQVATAD